MILPRWLYFGTAMSSLVLLTYAGTLFTFSVPVTDEHAAEHPTLIPGSRVIVRPVSAPGDLRTLADGVPADLLVTGSGGNLPMNARDVRVGRAIVHVPLNASGMVEVEGNDIDLASFSQGKEGWIAVGAPGSEAWFAPRASTLGAVDRSIATGALWALFGAGLFGFITPLVLVVLTHRGGKPSPKAPSLCRECGADMAAATDFCTRCGAYRSGDAKA